MFPLNFSLTTACCVHMISFGSCWTIVADIELLIWCTASVGYISTTPVVIICVFVVKTDSELNRVIHSSHFLAPAVVAVKGKCLCSGKQHRIIMVTISPATEVNLCISTTRTAWNRILKVVIIFMVLVIPVFETTEEARRAAPLIPSNAVLPSRPCKVTFTPSLSAVIGP